MPGEHIMRLTFFFSTLLALALWEHIAPRRPLSDRKDRRWFANLSLVAIDTAAAHLLFPLLPVGMALLARERGWGMLNIVVLPFWVEAALAFLILDFVIYIQHVFFHFVPLLWRFHRVHHTDLDIDVTTGNRFHPVEILVSLGIKLAAVAFLGAPAGAVLAFEAVLNVTSMFNHGNIRIPVVVDHWLRLLIVTPDMHRVHHSIVPRETNSNFGFNLPWWDRLGGTYRAQPADGHEGMTIGLKEFRDAQKLTLLDLLLQPFVRRP
jgi:sterol desaturase/sphingolipid hydroxylase (fatty acid hydroxylase superfamily)